MSDEQLVYTNFTMDCPNCGPGTVAYENGQMKSHGCDYRPPALVIEMDGEMTVEELQERAAQAADDIGALAHFDGDAA